MLTTLKKMRRINISTIMYILLIEHKMDAFSVLDARDTLLLNNHFYSNAVELRKMVYRQILYFERKGWLMSDGRGKQKKYYVTDNFPHKLVVNKATLIGSSVTHTVAIEENYSILLKERREHEGELKIVLGEIDEYRSLLSRFPALEQNIEPLLQASKIRSTQLLGKVNVLTNILKSLSAEQVTC